MPPNASREYKNTREETSYRYLAVAHCDEAGKVTVEFEPICAWADYLVTGIDEDGDRFELVEAVPLVFDGDSATEGYFDTALGIAMHGDGKDWLAMAERMFGQDVQAVGHKRQVN